MKRIFKNIFVLVSILAAASCSNDEIDNKSPKIGTVTFNVGELATRTEFANPGTDGSQIHWQSTDTVGIYDNISLNKFTLIDISGKDASITGQADVNASRYYGIYPYSAYVSNNSGNFTFTIPTEQTAVENNFDPKANISLANASRSDSKMVFNNVGAWFQVSYSLRKINDVVVYANDEDYVAYKYAEIKYSYMTPTVSDFRITADAPLSGTFSKPSDNVNSALTAVDGVHSVSLKGTLQPSKQYYACIPPIAKNTSIQAHMKVNCTATKTIYNKDGDVVGTPEASTSQVIGTKTTSTTTALVRNNVYGMHFQSMVLTPEFSYTKVTGNDITWDGLYIAVYHDTATSKYYAMGTTLTGLTSYFPAIDITQYYDSNTGDIYIPADAGVINNQVIDFVMSTSADNTVTVNGHTAKVVESAAGSNQYMLYVNYPNASFSKNQYIYYSTNWLSRMFVRNATSITYPFNGNGSLKSGCYYFDVYKLKIKF